MSRSKIWRRRLSAPYLQSEARRILGKVARRIRRPELRVVSLPARGERRGRALVSYIIDALLLGPDRSIPHSHTHFWESRQIALTFAELGFDVDVIHWTNARFVPAVDYDAFLDVRLNLERLAPLLGERCLRIQHIETAHHAYHNAAQLARLAALERRRGTRIAPRKLIEVNRAIETAHCGIALGNDFTLGTYAHAGRKIHPIAISAPALYPSPDGKDFDACRRSFVWFGSGGLVHKGLDLALEAFAGLPEYRLFVCGPVHVERDFERAYATELYDTPNIETVGWVDVTAERFRRICERSLGLVYPSCSEGCSGSTATCLHAGLIPLVTRQTGIDFEGFGVELEDISVEGVRSAVVSTSALGAENLRRMATAAWAHARQHHTREAFAASYRRILSEILGDWSRGRIVS